jgi:hypothetical protein
MAPTSPDFYQPWHGGGILLWDQYAPLEKRSLCINILAAFCLRGHATEKIVLDNSLAFQKSRISVAQTGQISFLTTFCYQVLSEKELPELITIKLT